MNARRRLHAIALFALWVVAVWMALGNEGLAAGPSAAAGQSTAQAPIEKGRVTVTQVCIGCHVGINSMLEIRKKSADEWRDTIYRMIGRGAQVFPDEIEPLTAYLVASAGRGRAQTPTAATNKGGLAEEAAAILARRCRQCHDVERASAKPASGDWLLIIDRMVALGASLTPAERQTLIEYLTERP